MTQLSIGDKAPGFKTLNQNGQSISLENLKGKKVILFVFALSVIAGPSLAWGWGEGGCSY